MSSPTRAAQSQFLSALQVSKSRLPYLSQNDWTLIIDRSKPVRFKAKEVMIQQSITSKVIYLIASGKVNVSIWGTQLARLGPGEICGEMAFLEDSTPSATAIAEDEVQAFAVEWQSLVELFELFPHLASRFYRSLAVNLSRRLREQIIPKKR
ncbi:MAG TPA: cyclic nucleotide-binding domain-containing protein [Terriglobales bacterium]|nr:cyclic nucleotide-binding domain-containing protein [Terriglobales bacterium]